MSDKHLKLSPHKIRGIKTAWWYEEPQGITIIVEPHKDTISLKILWKHLQPAVQRKVHP